MREWISFQHVEGNASRQAHCDLPKGTYEREMGREGFFGPATHLFHKHPPTGWIDFDGPLRPSAFDLLALAQEETTPFSVKPVMENAKCRISMWSCDKPMDYLVRNGDGDWLLFVHKGSGDFFCDFGHLEYSEGDYLVVPRSAMWRLAPSAHTQILLVEATNGSFMLPNKGIAGRHAIFDPAVLAVPRIDEKFKAQQNEDRWKVLVKRLGDVTTITYPFNPLDAVGWKGDLSVVRLNWRDIRPLMSHSYHLPPSAHITFVADGFVVCTFVPRPMESAPDALKLPFFHSNDDYDEFLFYHRGKFFSRDNIKPGMCTLHPCGFPHGPHPKAFLAAEGNAGKMTDEVAVMIDTRDALAITDHARSVEWKDYVNTWKAKEGAAAA
jgi:homogentisate 1,2-dioxygenase